MAALLWVVLALAAAGAVLPQGSPQPPALAAIALSIRSRGEYEVYWRQQQPNNSTVEYWLKHDCSIQDSRCYLMNGGAVESFFIGEDTPVGSIIGTLSVNGDPGESSGDITLRVQEKNAAVALAPGSKNVTLTRALDREERLGPAGAYVNVRCDRRRSADPSFVIPVSVRVWDVNDNAPVWSGAPYRARVSELAAVGARVLAAPATDPDQPGPHATVHYSVLPGPASEYVGFANELDSTVVVKKPLDYETLRNFTVVLRAQDGGSPPLYNDTTLSVEVLDADDQNPKFTYEHYSAVVPDDAQEGTILETFPGPISARDQDEGLSSSVRYSVRGAAPVVLHADTAALSAARRLAALALPVTVVIQATQTDNPDRYALATLSLSRAAAARFPRTQYSARLPEDSAPGRVLLALPAGDGPAGPLQYYVSDRSFLKQFAINGAGEVILRHPLDRDVKEYSYQVMVTDGRTNDTARINITVDAVNEWEPRFKHPQYSFLLSEAPGERAVRVGRLDVHDGDTEDTVAIHLSGPDADVMSVNERGEVFVSRAALLAPDAPALHVVATAVDSGTPPRQTSVPLSVRVAEAARAGAGGAVGAGGGAGVKAGALAGAGALVALIVTVLLLYLHKVRRKRQVKDKSATTALPEKSAPLSTSLNTLGTTGSGGREGSGAVGVTAAAVGPGSPAPGVGGGSGSLQSVSAGASSILAASTTSLEVPDKQQDKPQARVALMSDHLQGGAGRSGVAWPRDTIPARVKTLSWGDADQERPDLTVYF